MSNWNLQDLQDWDDRICEIAKKHGLDWYPITYETCDYYEMLGNMSYHGMPTHYGHWSYGNHLNNNILSINTVSPGYHTN